MKERILAPLKKVKTAAPDLGDMPKWWRHENLTPDAPPNPEIPQFEDFKKLHAMLLNIGGHETCFPKTEPDLDKILTRGYYRNRFSTPVRGEPGHCHSNVADIYERQHKTHKIRIATGYALSNDGIWRQHSWIVQTYFADRKTRTRVIETTEKRLAYFGFELDPDEADKFCKDNW